MSRMKNPYGWHFILERDELSLSRGTPRAVNQGTSTGPCVGMLLASKRSIDLCQ